MLHRRFACRGVYSYDVHPYVASPVDGQARFFALRKVKAAGERQAVRATLAISEEQRERSRKLARNRSEGYDGRGSQPIKLSAVYILRLLMHRRLRWSNPSR
jgi:hypothetical protein